MRKDPSPWMWVNIAFLLGWLTACASQFEGKNHPPLLPPSHLDRRALSSLSLSSTQLMEQFRSSIVTITTYDGTAKPLSRGHGFFIDSQHIVSNRHVFEHAQQGKVELYDGRVFAVPWVVAEDTDADLILVSIAVPRTDIRPFSVAGTLPHVGETIMIMGSPALALGVSTGIVSALQSLPDFGPIFQVSTPIEPGLSGSPVVNAQGQVIGIITGQLWQQGKSTGFAVPGVRLITLKPQKAQPLATWTAINTPGWLQKAANLYTNGLSLLRYEEYQRALLYFEEAVKKNPRHQKAWFYIGYCRVKLGLYEEAIAPFKQAIHLHPSFADAYYNLGVVYGRLQRYTEGLKAYKEAIRLQPDHSKAYYNLGVIYSKLGNYREALAAFKQATVLTPDDAKAHLNVGLMYLLLNQPFAALEHYKILRSLNPESANRLWQVMSKRPMPAPHSML